MRTRSILVVAIFFFACFAALGAGKKEAEKKQTIVLMPPHLVSPYYITMIDAAKQAAEKYPSLVIDVKAPTAEPGLEEQMAMLEDTLQKDVFLIGITSINWEAVTPLLQRAIQKGIKVALLDVDTHIQGVDAITAIGVDNIEGGREAGRYTVKQLNGKGRVAILEGVTGDYWSERRVRGFREIVDQNPGIEIVTIQPAKWAREEALAVMENILQTHQDLDLVWGLNGNMALGAMKAIQDAGLENRTMVVGYNGDAEEIEAIKAGNEKATVAQNPAGIGRCLVEDVAVKMLEGRKDEIPRVIPIPVTIVTAENVNQLK